MSATRQDQQQSGKPSRRRRIYDALSFLFGWALVYQQAFLVKPSEVNEAFLVLAGTLLITPFGADRAQQALAKILGTGGGGSDSPSPSPAPAPPSPSSSSAEER